MFQRERISGLQKHKLPTLNPGDWAVTSPRNSHREIESDPKTSAWRRYKRILSDCVTGQAELIVSELHV